ncbi:MAG: hypothetical protein ACUVSS_15105 [Anaerolineae bacterium]
MSSGIAHSEEFFNRSRLTSNQQPGSRVAKLTDDLARGGLQDWRQPLACCCALQRADAYGVTHVFQ